MRLAELLPVALALAFLSCTPHIGDKCQLSTDCSIQGSRLCDTSQPNGYCTVLNCAADSCPDTATCVLFEPELPGCPYSDRNPARTGRTLCLERCHSDSDCRQIDGYVCADPRQSPWGAVIVDDDQGQRVCIVAPAPPLDAGPGDGATPAVCGPTGPFVPPIEAGVQLEGVDAGAPDSGAPDTGAPDAGATDAATSG